LPFPGICGAFHDQGRDVVLKEESVESADANKHFLLRFLKKRAVHRMVVDRIRRPQAGLCGGLHRRVLARPAVWENYPARAEAKGESFDWDALIPPRVPDAKIFSARPR